MPLWSSPPLVHSVVALCHLVVRALFFVSWYAAYVSAWFLANVTVDDTNGDVATGAYFAYYSPEGSWSDEANCTEADMGTACPSAEYAYDGTWHATGPGVSSAEISFTGSGFYVYCIINSNKSTDLTFMIDGETEGTYQQGTDTSESASISYDVLVYANDSLPWGTHTFTLVSGANTQGESLAILDYITYTARVDLSTDTTPGSQKSSQTRAIVIAVVVVGIAVLLALGAVVYYLRKRPYKGYGPPVDRFLCKRGSGRANITRAPVDLAQNVWDDRGPRNQRSTSSLRKGLLTQEHGSRLQAPPPTMVSTGSTASVNENSVPTTIEDNRAVVESVPRIAVPPPAASQATTTQSDASGPTLARHGLHSAAPQLVVTIPQRVGDVVAENPSHPSTADTPPPLPPKGSAPGGMQKKWPVTSRRFTPPNGHQSTPPTAFPQPITPPIRRGRRPKSEIASRSDGSSNLRQPSAKRFSTANSTATPSTGQRSSSGMIASDRTTPSTPTSMAPSGFWMDNMSSPDLPARADSVKTINTMPMTGRICDRLLGNVYVDMTPLPDMTNFSLRSDTGKSSDTASQSPGTVHTSSTSPASNPSTTSPTAVIAALEPVPMVDTRRGVVDSPISLPNSPDIPLLAATLQVVTTAELVGSNPYGSSAVPASAHLQLPSEYTESRDQASEAPLTEPEDAKPPVSAETTVISAPPEDDVAPSGDVLRPSSPEHSIGADSQQATAPLEPDTVDATFGHSPPPPDALVVSPVVAVDVAHGTHEDQPQTKSHPREEQVLPNPVPPPESSDPLPRLTIPRQEGERLRKLPPLPLHLMSRLTTVHEDAVSPRFIRPLPRPLVQPDSDRIMKLSRAHGELEYAVATGATADTQSASRCSAGDYAFAQRKRLAVVV
ncbi:hypothetical protein EVJ58_g36 [Rhodofomes roseus]|uniref:Uncharacterized protein n=1 Tax=Rhodofomes roseus TaxID=34475 RepID=A0A4Y9Z8E5_9APHY|nr:hypothetical protein EVJ58_g36 [Rhodofomes roseus]